MLLTAFLDGVKIDLTAEPTERILDWHEDGQRFVMSDGCDTLGRIKRTFYGKFGFWHLPGGGSCKGESEEHLEAKRNLAMHCRSLLPKESVEVEHPVPGHPQRIDVTAVTGAGVKWAFEVQRSGQGQEETRERTRILNDLEYLVAWFFFRDGQLVGVRDGPRALHFVTDVNVAEIRHLAPPARKRAKASKEFVAVPGPDLVERILAGGLKWLGRTTFTHARRGVGTVSTFTCRCKAHGVYPCKEPPCRHLAACGFEVDVAECPIFDWPRHIWSDPRIIPGGLPFAKAFMTKPGSSKSRCHVCKSRIRPKRGPWGEPERRILEIPVALPPISVQQSEVGHWCGLTGTSCEPPPTREKVRVAGQMRLFDD